ncbi:hypothetical protein T190115A13A_60019 [Tenacibaculum sp. 190524A02b]|uniref:Uncharacterized protein n=2 Tax=Tenacibaculum vairaonense TaxID=3137860 RepID=A0ABM9PQG9_9FLAO
MGIEPITFRTAIVFWITIKPSSQVTHTNQIQNCMNVYNGAIQKHTTRLA